MTIHRRHTVNQTAEQWSIEVTVGERGLHGLLSGLPPDVVTVRRVSLGMGALDTNVQVIVLALASSPVLVQLLKSLEALLRKQMLRKITVRKDGELVIEGISSEELEGVVRQLKEHERDAG
jgi:hypothetical protein